MLLVGATMVGAIAAYIKTTDAEPQDRMQQIPATKIVNEPSHDRGNVTVYTPRYEKDQLEYNQESKAVPEGNDRIVFAVNEYLSNAKISPPEARLEKCVIVNHVARLSFTSTFEKTYGAEDEKTLLDGILRTLGQFEDVEKVQFLIGSTPLESLGNIDLSEPVEVIRPAR